MQRVLDLDLDFFVHGTASWRGFDDPRLDPEEFPPWELTEAMAFLEERCHLLSTLPGCAVEHHGAVFGLWREALLAGVLTAPFHVTHLDAHADLGMGELGHMYLLTEFLEQAPRGRWYPRESRDPYEEAMTDGSWLAFAVGCRWISDLTICPGGGDIHPYIMEDWNPRSGTIQMARLTKDELKHLKGLEKPGIAEHQLEPPVPLTLSTSEDFVAPEAFDFIFLARSPAFTPSQSDPIYEAIRERFIDESSFREAFVGRE
jgi:hypothetical protein